MWSSSSAPGCRRPWPVPSCRRCGPSSPELSPTSDRGAFGRQLLRWRNHRKRGGFARSTGGGTRTLTPRREPNFESEKDTTREPSRTLKVPRLQPFRIRYRLQTPLGTPRPSRGWRQKCHHSQQSVGGTRTESAPDLMKSGAGIWRLLDILTVWGLKSTA